MTFSRLPESVTEALALRAGVPANADSSASLWDDRVRFDMLQSILPFIVPVRDCVGLEPRPAHDEPKGQQEVPIRSVSYGNYESSAGDRVA